jgi:hypothetical protein
MSYFISIAIMICSAFFVGVSATSLYYEEQVNMNKKSVALITECQENLLRNQVCELIAKVVK